MKKSLWIAALAPISHPEVWWWERWNFFGSLRITVQKMWNPSLGLFFFWSVPLMNTRLCVGWVKECDGWLGSSGGRSQICRSALRSYSIISILYFLVIKTSQLPPPGPLQPGEGPGYQRETRGLECAWSFNILWYSSVLIKWKPKDVGLITQAWSPEQRKYLRPPGILSGHQLHQCSSLRISNGCPALVNHLVLRCLFWSFFCVN